MSWQGRGKRRGNRARRLCVFRSCVASGDLATDVVLGAIGLERDFRTLQPHQEFGLRSSVTKPVR